MNPRVHEREPDREEQKGDEEHDADLGRYGLFGTANHCHELLQSEIAPEEPSEEHQQIRVT